MNKRLIFILMFFFALLSPLILNAPSRIYDVFAVDPTPFGPGPVVPPGGGGGGAGGQGVSNQDCNSGKFVIGIANGVFKCTPAPTFPPTPTPVPASTPVAGQAVTGFDAGIGTVSRGSFQGVLPTATPVAGKAHSAWNGTSFTTVDIQPPLPTATPAAGKAVSGWNGTSFDTMDVQVPLPTATPVANEVLRDWNGTSFDASQLDYSEIANTPSLGTMASANTGDYLSVSTRDAADGVAPLDSNSLVPVANLPTIPDTSLASNGDLWKFSGGAAAASSTHDFTSAEWLKLPVVNGAYGSCANAIIYFDSADSTCPIHYCNGATDTAICGITFTGNTTKVVSNTGTNTEGDTVKWDANGNLVDNGLPIKGVITFTAVLAASGVACTADGTGAGTQYFGTIYVGAAPFPTPLPTGNTLTEVWKAPFAFTAKYFNCTDSSTPPTGETYTIHLYNVTGTANTDLVSTCTHNAACAGDTTHTAAIADGDQLAIQIVCSGGTTAGDASAGKMVTCTVGMM